MRVINVLFVDIYDEGYSESSFVSLRNKVVHKKRNPCYI